MRKSTLTDIGSVVLGLAIWGAVAVANFFVYQLAWNTSLVQLKANPFQGLIIVTLMLFSLIWTFFGGLFGGFMIWCGTLGKEQ